MSTDDFSTNWSSVDVISQRLDVLHWVAKNVVNMLESGTTIPFIARYRKEATGGMEVSKLRDIAALLAELKAVQQKIATVCVALQKIYKLTPDLLIMLKNSQSLSEVEDLYAPYKPGHKGTLAERARALNLEPLAMKYLKSPSEVDPHNFIKSKVTGISCLPDVVTGVKHIIADIIYRDKETVALVRDLYSSPAIVLETKQCKLSDKKKASACTKVKVAQETSYKYENYFDFRCSVKNIRPHQVLAINRAEEYKILAVKVNIPDHLKQMYQRLAERKFLHPRATGEVKSVVSKSIEECWSRLIQPNICRHVRSELTKNAEKSSIEVFSNNLKNLLLASPVKGAVIIGLDPGYVNGCKCAVITPTGQILHTGVVYLHSPKSSLYVEKSKLVSMIKQFRCDVCAIGNGTACRETETVISNVIKEHSLSLHYCIVDESGASIYSCSKEAEKEMPKLDPSLRGAVSIARRLLDPLAELVKIDPKHIGVGQYQHDLRKAELRSALDAVIEECVSFVGVDINTGSECLLRRVAGLSAAKAKKIIERRESVGLFKNREQLKFVSGVGEKSYEQCAGFLRVNSPTGDGVVRSEELISNVKKGKRKADNNPKGNAKKRKVEKTEETNPLDKTWIHPESYSVAEEITQRIGVQVQAIGEEHFIKKVENYTKANSVKHLAETLRIGEPTVQLILDAFIKPVNYDFREDEYDKPLFKQGICDMESLKCGTKVTGKVKNVTHFGAFVDIGVGTNGLLHTSKMKGRKVELGYRLEVLIQNVDLIKKRIGLELVKIL